MGGKRRGHPYMVLFNTSQFMLAVALAGGIQGLVSPPLDALAAASALYLANSWLVAVMAALHQRQNPLTVWRAGRKWSVLQAVVLLTVGVLTAHAVEAATWTPLILALPAAAVYASLRHMQAMEAAVRLRDEFLSIAAHELRTPLTSLRGYAQLFLRQLEKEGGGTGDERLRRAPRMIDQQAERLTRLVDDLSDASRLQSGKLVLERRPVDLAEVAHGVVAALQPVTPGYRLVVHAEGPVHVVADRLRLEQVLTNLITNAATHAGGEQIDVGVAAPTGEQACLVVRDYGVGIPPTVRERIFEPYYQAPGEGARRGLGLGLHISRQIVELHGGTITVDCPADGGTLFSISLPRGHEPPRTRLRSRGLDPQPALRVPRAAAGPDGPAPEQAA